MQWSAVVSLLLYAGCLALYLVTPDATFADPGERAAVGLRRAADVGVIAGNIRTIAMPTLVTLLIPRSAATGRTGWSAPPPGCRSW